MKKEYTVQEFFSTFKEVTISGVAKQAGMNESLLRQYAIGIKIPSKPQAKKIEKAIHAIGKELKSVDFGIILSK